MNAKKILFLILGCFGLVMGAVGAVLPLLPAFPFCCWRRTALPEVRSACTPGSPEPASTRTTWKALSKARA